MKPIQTLICYSFTAMLIGCFAVEARLLADEKITFDDQVKPLLNQRCASCHNPNNKSGDLDVTNFTALMLGGGSGTVIELGEPSSSYLYKLITHEESPEMPPDGDKLPDAEIELIKNWIAGGALENKSSKVAPKKKKVAAVAGDATVRPEVVPVPCKLSLDVAAVPHRSPAVMAMATSPWAPVVAVGTPFQVLLFDTQTQQLRGVLPFPEGHIFSLRFSRNGSLLLAAGGRAAANGVAVAWDIQTGERVVEISGLMDAVLAADISSDHMRIAVGTTDRLVRIFDTGSGKQLHEIKKHTDWIQAIEFSPDGVLLASGDRSGGLLVWEAKTGREYLDLRGHQGPITGLSWRVDSNLLASGSQDSTIRLWEMENGGQVANWGGHGGGVTSVQFTRDSRIVSGGRDNQVKIFNQSGGQEKGYPWSNILTVARLCDETNRVIACDLNGQVNLRDVATDAELGSLNLVIPTLANRVAEAASQLEQVQQQNKVLMDRSTSLQELVSKRQTELTAMESQMRDLKDLQQMLDEKIQQTSRELASSQSQLGTAEELVARLGPGVSNLNQAMEAVQRALTTMESAQLETSLKQLTELKQANETRLSMQLALVEQLPSKITELKMQLADFELRVKKTTDSLSTLEQKLTVVGAELAELQPQLASAMEQLQEFQPRVDSALAQHQELQQAAEFARREEELLQQLAEQMKQFENVAQGLDAHQTKEAELLRAIAEFNEQAKPQIDQVTAWQLQVEEQQKSEVELNTAIEANQKLVALSMSRQESLRETVTKLAASVSALEQALAIDQDDPEIKQAWEKLQSLQQQKGQALDAEVAQVQTWEAEIVERQAQIVQLQQQQTELAAMIEKSQTEIAQVQAQAAPLELAIAEERTVITGINRELEQLQDSLQRTRDQVLQLRGVQLVSDQATSAGSGTP